MASRQGSDPEATCAGGAGLNLGRGSVRGYTTVAPKRMRFGVLCYGAPTPSTMRR